MTTILVIDDEPLLLNTLKRLFLRAGYQVVAYPDAAPALAGANFDTIDVIVTDCGMPMPGDVAIEVLRARGIDRPVVALSGRITDELIARLEQVGANRIVGKPFNPKDLLQAVSELVG